MTLNTRLPIADVSRNAKMAYLGNPERMQQIELSTLTIQQLNQLKNDVSQDLTIFNDSLNILISTKAKFANSGRYLNKITPDTAGTEVLVPLTSSMYVPGRIVDSKNVMIEVGTGYYINQDVNDAKDYFKRKVEYVGDQIDKIQVMAAEKVKIREVITEVLQLKIQEANLAGAKMNS